MKYILRSVPLKHFVGSEDTNVDIETKENENLQTVDNENLHENVNVDFIVSEDIVETENILDTSDHYLNINHQGSVGDCGFCRFCLDKPKNGGKGKLKKKV